MTTGTGAPPLRAPYFHQDSGSVRFWVLVDSLVVGASIRKEVLHYRFSPDAQGEDPMQTFTAAWAEIEAAVRCRVAQGSIEPVMLREADLRPAGR